MQLTVLGCYGPYPAAGQNCSGYLVEDEAAVVLLDCGSGVLSRLRHFVEPWELNAVILTHLHSDHMADVLIIRYALLIKRLQEAGLPLLVYAPAQPKEEFSRLAYKNVVQSKPLSSNTTLTIGTMRFTFTPAVHAITAYMITVESGGKKLVYSGDTEYFPRMHEVIKDADLFLCEANYLRRDVEQGHPNHMAAFQAAQAAQQGHVKRLVLTHHHPERDPQQTLLEAQEYFANTEVARSGSLYKL